MPTKKFTRQEENCGKLADCGKLSWVNFSSSAAQLTREFQKFVLEKKWKWKFCEKFRTQNNFIPTNFSTTPTPAAKFCASEKFA
jgi:hypothetical protein